MMFVVLVFAPLVSEVICRHMVQLKNVPWSKKCSQNKFNFFCQVQIRNVATYSFHAAVGRLQRKFEYSSRNLDNLYLHSSDFIYIIRPCKLYIFFHTSRVLYILNVIYVYIYTYIIQNTNI